MKRLFPLLLTLGCSGGGAKPDAELAQEKPALEKPAEPAAEKPTLGSVPIPARGPIPRLPAFPKAPAHGEVRTELKGCLTAAKEEDARKYGLSKAAPKGPAVVKQSPFGLSVVHELAHACCLTGAISAKVEGQKVEISEVLTGNPCKCMCRSTLRTDVGLSPGDYQVSVTLSEREAVKTVHTQPVTIAPVSQPSLPTTAPTDDGAPSLNRFAPAPPSTP